MISADKTFRLKHTEASNYRVYEPLSATAEEYDHTYSEECEWTLAKEPVTFLIGGLFYTSTHIRTRVRSGQWRGERVIFSDWWWGTPEAERSPQIGVVKGTTRGPDPRLFRPTMGQTGLIIHKEIDLGRPKLLMKKGRKSEKRGPREVRIIHPGFQDRVLIINLIWKHKLGWGKQFG